MKDANLSGQSPVGPEMTILEIVERHPGTEAVFIKKYDQQAGACLCCQALFEPLGETAKKYGLDIEALLNDLDAAVRGAQQS